MSTLFVILSCFYVLLCISIITMIIMQKKRSAGLGNLSGMGSSQTYWDKNKKRSFEGKLETYTKISSAAFFVFTIVLCLVK